MSMLDTLLQVADQTAGITDPKKLAEMEKETMVININDSLIFIMRSVEEISNWRCMYVNSGFFCVILVSVCVILLCS